MDVLKRVHQLQVLHCFVHVFRPRSLGVGCRRFCRGGLPQPMRHCVVVWVVSVKGMQQREQVRHHGRQCNDQRLDNVHGGRPHGKQQFNGGDTRDIFFQHFV